MTMSWPEAREVIEIYYLRPGNLLKDFFITSPVETVNEIGRPVKKYSSVDEKNMIRAVLALATPQEKARWEQIQHPITHTIVANGKLKAKPKDLLTHDGRKFFVQGVDEPGELGLAAIYYVEERFDL